MTNDATLPAGTYTCQLVSEIPEWVLNDGSCHDEEMNPIAVVELSSSNPEALAVAIIDSLDTGTIKPMMAITLLADLSSAAVIENGTIIDEEGTVR